MVSQSPLPSVDYLDLSEDHHGFTLSDVSSLRSMESEPSDDLNLDNEKNLRHISYLITEMRDTEVTYIDALTDVTKGYIQKIRSGENSGFTEKTIKDVFINIEDIREFHIEFHKELTGCRNNHVDVARLFIRKLNVITEMYLQYCASFPYAWDVLLKLHEVEPSKSFLVECQRTLNHMFPVDERLHRPVQRVLKYPLLFRDMTKKLKGLEGHDIVEEALNKILQTAVRINAVKRVQELQSTELIAWHGPNLSVMGDLLLEDSFKMTGAKDPRYLFLFEKCLLVTKKREAEGNVAFVFKSLVQVENITLKENIDEDYLKWSIVVNKDRESYVLQARDTDQKEQWINEIKRCIVYTTPGLTELQKEELLKKLPSMRNNSEQLDKLWKRVLKKNKNKHQNGVEIIHNTVAGNGSSECSEYGYAPSTSSSNHSVPLASPQYIGKRKLSKKKSVVKISSPVPVISEPGSLQARPSLVKITRAYSPPAKKRAEEIDVELSPSTENYCQAEIDGSLPQEHKKVSPNSGLGMDCEHSPRASSAFFMEYPMPPNRNSTSPSLTELLDYDRVKEAVASNINSNSKTGKICGSNSNQYRNDVLNMRSNGTDELGSVKVSESAVDVLLDEPSTRTFPTTLPSLSNSSQYDIDSIPSIHSCSSTADTSTTSLSDFSRSERSTMLREPSQSLTKGTTKPVQTVKPFSRELSSTDITPSPLTDDKFMLDSEKGGLLSRKAAVKKKQLGENDAEEEKEEIMDSQSDFNIETEKSEEPMLITGVQSVVERTSESVVTSRYYPGNLLLIIYTVMLVLCYSPWYVTYPLLVVIPAALYRQCSNQKEDKKKVG